MTDAARAGVHRDVIIDQQVEFIMVPFAHLQAIERRVGGIARTRTFGFLVELYRLAAVQGHIGEHIYLTSNVGELAGQMALGRNTIPQYLQPLSEFGVLGVTQTVWSPEDEGRERIRIEFKGLRRPFAHLTTPALTLIGRGLSGTNYIGALGLYVALRRICFEQREQHGNRYASISRRQLARVTGTSPRWITDTGKLLERQGVVRREETTTQNGRNWITNWWLLNVTDEQLADRPLDAGEQSPQPAGRKECDGAAESVQPAVQDPCDGAAGFPVGGAAGFSEAPAAASTAHTRAGETGSENGFTDQSSPPNSAQLSSAGVGEETENSLADDRRKQCEAICETFASWLVADTSPAVLDRPGSWHSARPAWLDAAGELLDEGYGPERLAEILEDLASDIKIGDQLRHLTDLPPRIHDAAKRAAHQRRASQRQGAARQGNADASFDELMRIVQNHGQRGYETAKQKIAALGPHAEQFVSAAGWSNLCNATHYDDGKLRRMWQETATAASPAR